MGRRWRGVEDINNDGLGDVLIGAPYEDPGSLPTDCGMAYVYSGGSGAILDLLVDIGPLTSYGYYGYTISVVPDVNGDSFDDAVVGAPGEADGAGQAHILSPFDAYFIDTIASPLTGGDGTFGFSVAGVSDLNGDGRGDIVVGDPDQDSTLGPSRGGMAFVFSGATRALLRKISLTRRRGQRGFRRGGRGASTTLNGDGRGDIVVGAQSEGGGASPAEAGRAYLWRSGHLYVDADSNTPSPGGTSWADAFRHIDDAVDWFQEYGAGAYGVIWVAEGDYSPDDPPFPKGASFRLYSQLAYYGGFEGDEEYIGQRDIDAYVTRLTGDYYGDDDPNGWSGRDENTWHVVVGGDGVDASAVLDGFTISGGAARLDPNDPNLPPARGGGMYLR